MTDKEKIKKEIERLRHSTLNAYDRSRFMLLSEIEDFIDSLPEEPTSKDLEEAAKHYLYSEILYDDFYTGNPTEEDCIRCFKAGSEWQKQQMMKKKKQRTMKNEDSSDKCPCCGWALDSDGCCCSCGYGRR